MVDKLLFKFTLNEVDKKYAEFHGMATVYEVRRPKGYADKLAIWWDEEEGERSTIYKETTVNENIESGVWIKL